MHKHSTDTTKAVTSDDVLLEPRNSVQDSPLRVVALDAVGTVMYADPPVTAVYAAVLREVGGQEVAADVIKSVLSRHLQNRSDEEELRTSEEQEKAFWSRVIAEIIPDSSCHQACFSILFRHFSRPESWRCYDDVEPAIQDLLAMNVQVVIASNFDKRLHAVCQGLKPLQSVSEIIVSSEVGWRKPAAAFFDSVCRRTRVHPSEVLFVGDDLHNDVYGAKRAGMTTVWVDRASVKTESVQEQRTASATETYRRVTSLAELPALFAGST